MIKLLAVLGFDAVSIDASWHDDCLSSYCSVAAVLARVWRYERQAFVNMSPCHFKGELYQP